MNNEQLKGKACKGQHSISIFGLLILYMTKILQHLTGNR
jgi:hypothetical protein